MSFSTKKDAPQTYLSVYLGRRTFQNAVGYRQFGCTAGEATQGKSVYVRKYPKNIFVIYLVIYLV